MDLLPDDETRVLGGLHSAGTYLAMTRTLDQAGAATAPLAEIVDADPSMSAQVLEIATSIFLGVPHRLSSARQAALFLGTDFFRGIVLVTEVYATMERRRVQGFSVDRLREHALMTAQFARRLVSDRRLAEHAATTALLLNVGQIALAQTFDEQFGRALAVAQDTGRPLYEVERQMLGLTHAETGAYLLGLWGMPLPVIDAVGDYHRLDRAGVPSRELLAAVHIADTLVTELTAEAVPGAVPHGLDLAFLRSTGRVIELRQWRDLAEEVVPAGRRHGQQLMLRRSTLQTSNFKLRT